MSKNINLLQSHSTYINNTRRIIQKTKQSQTQHTQIQTTAKYIAYTTHNTMHNTIHELTYKTQYIHTHIQKIQHTRRTQFT